MRLENILSISLSMLIILFLILQLFPNTAKPITEPTKKSDVKQVQDRKPTAQKAVMVTYVLPAPPPIPVTIAIKTPVPENVPAKPKIPEKPAMRQPKKDPAKKYTHLLKPITPVKQKEAQNKPTPKPATTAISQTVAHVATQNIKEGRAMLRILEHGVGPVIDIAWPKNSNQRAELYKYFVSCLGMTTALMNGQGNLYRNADPRNHRWELNLDRYSGFLRQPSGEFSVAEADILQKIRRRHSQQNKADPVRIFPRKVDAYLLGGLQTVIGPGYKNSKSIRATYHIQNHQLRLINIQADTHMKNGSINLSAVSRCRART